MTGCQIIMSSDLTRYLGSDGLVLSNSMKLYTDICTFAGSGLIYLIFIKTHKSMHIGHIYLLGYIHKFTKNNKWLDIFFDEAVETVTSYYIFQLGNN